MIWTFFLIDLIYNNGTDMRKIQPPTLQKVVGIKEILIYFLTIKSVLYFLSFILTLLERKRIMNEIKGTIYNYIDNNINEDIFNNIIDQCKQPHNNDLKQKFTSLLNDKNTKNRCSISEISSDFDRNNIQNPLLQKDKR